MRMTTTELRKLELGSLLLKAVLRLFGSLALCGGTFLLEHPADPGQAPYPSIWSLPETNELKKNTGAETIRLDQCMFGQPFRKATFIMTNAFSDTTQLQRRCCHSSHQPLQGQAADGSFNTQAAQTYPSELCKTLATIIYNDLRHMLITNAGPDPTANFADEKGDTFPPTMPGRSPMRRRHGERVRVPPLASTWAPVKRWRTTYAGKWETEEHIGIQELRTVTGLLRHLARSRANWRRRVLIFTDSMATLGAMGKGRSSAPAFLRLCRQVTAISLAFGILPIMRYIASELNPADGPSRGLPVGAADETIAAHSDRLATSLRGQPSSGIASPSEVAHLLAKARACSGYAGG